MALQNSLRNLSENYQDFLKIISAAPVNNRFIRPRSVLGITFDFIATAWQIREQAAAESRKTKRPVDQSF